MLLSVSREGCKWVGLCIYMYIFIYLFIDKYGRGIPTFFFYSVYVHRGKYMVIEKKAKEREDEPRIYKLYLDSIPPLKSR